MCSVRVHSHSHSLLERPRAGVWYGGAEKGPVARRGIVGQALGFHHVVVPRAVDVELCSSVSLKIKEHARIGGVYCPTKELRELDSKNGSSIMRRTRSLVHAVRSYSPSSSLRFSSARGPVNACDTFHVHARRTRCAAVREMRTRLRRLDV